MSNGTVYDLQPGVAYHVLRDFQDCYGAHVAAGTLLTFQKRDYLPYHGGHTVTFAERKLYFQDEDSANVLQDLWTYLEPIGNSSAPT